MAGKLSSHSAQASFLPLLLWAGVIFLLSSMPGSGADFEPPLWYILERKSAHVFEYAVLMLLSFRFVRAMFSVERFSWQVLLAGVFSLAYAATDELHQFFVFGRGAKMTDVLIDGLGIVVMVGGLLLLQKLSKKKVF